MLNILEFMKTSFTIAVYLVVPFLPTAVVDAGSISCFKRLLSNVDLLTTHLNIVIICNLGLPLTVCFNFLFLSMIAMFAVILRIK
jgi:hypothetical protein